MRSRPRHLSQIGSNLGYAMVVVAASGVESVDTPDHTNPSVSAVLVVHEALLINASMCRCIASMIYQQTQWEAQVQHGTWRPSIAIM